jgi:hypothetical protein
MEYDAYSHQYWMGDFNGANDGVGKYYHKMLNYWNK